MTTKRGMQKSNIKGQNDNAKVKNRVEPSSPSLRTVNPVCHCEPSPSCHCERSVAISVITLSSFFPFAQAKNIFLHFNLSF